MPSEVHRIEQAVDKFAADMKRRMIEKAAEGKKGWDSPGQKEFIRQDMMDDALASHPDYLGDKPDLYVDIANRAMMLWGFLMRNHDTDGGETE